MSHAAAAVVLVDSDSLQQFLSTAVALYKRRAPDGPLACSGVLLGVLDGATARVERIEFCRTAADPGGLVRGADKLEILGSIHMRCAGSASGLPQSGPVTIVCHLERIAGSIGYTLQAWGPAVDGEPAPELQLRIRTACAEQPGVA